MTIQQILRDAGSYLKERNIEDPSREAGLLLSWYLKKDLGYLYGHMDMELDENTISGFMSLIERRGRHEPYGYITGQCEFMSLTFEVNPAVLIPRADTEILAEAVLFALGKFTLSASEAQIPSLPKKKIYRGLDMGTGSGCLAISIAKYMPSIIMDAVDISEEALNTARRNAIKHKVINRVNFFRDDILSDSFISRYTEGNKYDIIVSNPPYIPDGDIPTLMPSVKDYEPYNALAGGEDGLIFYRAIAKLSEKLLADDGILAVECGFDQAEIIRDIFAREKLKSVFLKDFSGINRVIVAIKQV